MIEGLMLAVITFAFISSFEPRDYTIPFRIWLVAFFIWVLADLIRPVT